MPRWGSAVKTRDMARLWQASRNLASSDGMSGRRSRAGVRAGNRDLVGRGVHQLPARELFDQIEIDMARLHLADMLLKKRALTLQLDELFLADPEFRLRVGEREHAARTPDRVIAEIGGDRAADRRQYHCRENPRHTSPDSHQANES